MHSEKGPILHEQYKDYKDSNRSRRKFLGAMSVSLATLACGGANRTSEDQTAQVSATPKVRGGDEKAPPRLQIHHNEWGLRLLPRGGKEWSFEEKVRRVKEAGFVGWEMDTGLDFEPQVLELLAKYKLDLGMGCAPRTFPAMRKDIESAKKAGAKYLVPVAGNPVGAYMSDEEMFAYVRDSMQVAADNDMPLLWETHRGSLTQSPYRLLRLLEKIPQMHFCADLSHWAVVDSLGSSAERMIQAWEPVLDHFDAIQCRISTGSQVQVDVGDGSSKLAQEWMKLWAEIMRRWLKRAQPGEFFPVAPELGPPSYSIVGLDGKEISDRWEQSLVMKKLTEQAWESAQKA